MWRALRWKSSARPPPVSLLLKDSGGLLQVSCYLCYKNSIFRSLGNLFNSCPDPSTHCSLNPDEGITFHWYQSLGTEAPEDKFCRACRSPLVWYNLHTSSLQTFKLTKPKFIKQGNNLNNEAQETRNSVCNETSGKQTHIKHEENVFLRCWKIIQSLYHKIKKISVSTLKEKNLRFSCISDISTEKKKSQKSVCQIEKRRQQRVKLSQYYWRSFLISSLQKKILYSHEIIWEAGDFSKKLSM